MNIGGERHSSGAGKELIVIVGVTILLFVLPSFLALLGLWPP